MHYQTTFVSLEKKKYKKIHFKLENDYLRSKSNEQNMYFVYTLAKLLKIVVCFYPSLLLNHQLSNLIHSLVNTNLTENMLTFPQRISMFLIL